jgi:ABC-type amino acid transport substrate-binding protein
MDERRIERALQQGPPDEPTYEESIAAQIRTASADARAEAGVEATYRGTVRRVRIAPIPGLATLVAAAAVLVVGLVVVRPLVVNGPGSSTPPDLLARLRAVGTVRIAVTGDPPQTTAAGGAVIGFDVDVARELAKSLALGGEVSVAAGTDILGGRGGDWDLGLPSRGPLVGSGVTAGPAYYVWPSWLVTNTTSAITTVAQLDGATICAVSGSAGLEWLRGGGASPDTGTKPPPGAAVLERPNDAACVEALRSGLAAAAITAQLLDDEFAGQGLRALVADPAVQDRRVIIVRGNGPDVTTLIAALEKDLRSPSTSQALADASRRAFGGRDLTEGTP